MKETLTWSWRLVDAEHVDVNQDRLDACSLRRQSLTAVSAPGQARARKSLFSSECGFRGDDPFQAANVLETHEFIVGELDTELLLDAVHEVHVCERIPAWYVRRLSRICQEQRVVAEDFPRNLLESFMNIIQPLSSTMNSCVIWPCHL